MKIVTIFLGVILILFLAAPALAWAGVSGAVYDAYGAPWQHGFTVYMTGTVGGVPNQALNANGTPIPAGQHTFSAPFLTSPDVNTAVSVLIRFNDGGNGRPQSQLFTDLFVQTNFSRSFYFMGNINTGTGPTVIDLQSTSVIHNSASIFTGSALFVLLMATFITKSRRAKFGNQP